MRHFTQTPMKWANPLLFDEVGMRFPELKIILAHMGLTWFTDALGVTRKHRNVYADVTGVSLRPGWAYQALAAFYESNLLGKLLFGGDFPVMTVEDTIGALRNINVVVPGTGMPQIPADEVEAIIHRDTLRILELE